MGKIEQALAAAAAERDAARQAESDAQARLAEQRAQTDGKDDAARLLQAELDASRERCEELDRRAANLEAELAGARQEKDQQAGELARTAEESQAERARLQGSISELEATVAELRAQASDLSARSDTLRSQWESATTEADRANASVTALQSQVAALELQLRDAPTAESLATARAAADEERERLGQRLRAAAPLAEKGAEVDAVRLYERPAVCLWPKRTPPRAERIALLEGDAATSRDAWTETGRALRCSRSPRPSAER